MASIYSGTILGRTNSHLHNANDDNDDDAPNTNLRKQYKTLLYCHRTSMFSFFFCSVPSFRLKRKQRCHDKKTEERHSREN